MRETKEEEDQKEENSFEATLKFQNKILQNLEKIKKDADSYYRQEYILKFQQEENHFKEAIKEVSLFP